MSRSITQMVVALVLVAVGLYLLQMFVPVDATIYKLIIVVVVIGVIAWALRIFGLWGGPPIA
jgi:putative Mn2+ efflux pump MntP